MSLAPASSRGAFLKARLAVNGIQCAARSFGTFTAAGRGLLSSMGASSSFRIGGSGASYQLRRETGTLMDAYIFPLVRADSCAQIGGGDPEHLAVRILGVEPQQRDLRKCGFEQLAATADFAQQATLQCQVSP